MTKKLLLFSLVLCGALNAQIVNIPDASFKAKLLQASTSNNIALSSTGASIKIDANSDGEIQVSEALAVNVLNIGASNISSLEGIAAFNNMANLQAGSNQLTSLDVSMLPNLITLGCGFNSLTGLLLSPSIKRLNCNNNQLTALNLNGTGYNSLEIGYNQLTVITIPPCNFNGGFLDISGNLYTQIDLSQVVNPPGQGTRFICLNTKLTSLDLPQSSVYQNYNISGNEDLQFVNFKNGSDEMCPALSWSPECLAFMVLEDNPSLLHICVDHDNAGFSELAHFQYQQSLGNIPSTVPISTYCSFTPGGSFNTIAGKISIDIDSNGCSSSDPEQPI